MWQILKQSLIDWLKKYDRLAKLQHFYLFVAIISLIIGALVNFYHQQLAGDILIITKLSGLAFGANLIAGNLFEAFVLPKIKTLKPTTTTPKKVRTK